MYICSVEKRETEWSAEASHRWPIACSKVPTKALDGKRGSNIRDGKRRIQESVKTTPCLEEVKQPSPDDFIVRLQNFTILEFTYTTMPPPSISSPTL